MTAPSLTHALHPEADSVADGTHVLPLPQRALCRAFRVQQFNDVHARAVDLWLKLPLGRKRLNRLDRIRKAGALFIHVPKNGGTSVCEMLYGTVMMHETMRYYRHVAPDLCRDVPSFAIWRDPVERFVSAWAFARRGGTARVQIHPSFNALYRSFNTLDDALDHVEGSRSPYQIDHIFRQQSWYVCDREGRLVVDRLLSMSSITHLPALVPALSGLTIPHLNGNRHETQVTTNQIRRIRKIYRADMELHRAVTSLTA